jgi:hypothetical protein
MDAAHGAVITDPEAYERPRAYGSSPSIALAIAPLWFQRKSGRRTGVR